MQLRILLSLLALLLCCGLSAQKTTDRVKDRATNRAENRANRKLDQKVDDAVDDAFNAVGNLFKKKKKKKKNAPTDNDAPTTNDTPSTTPNGARYDDRVDDGGLAPNDGEEYEDEDEAMGAFSNFLGGSKDFEPFTNETSFSLKMVMTEVKKNGKTNANEMHIAVLPTRIATRINEVDRKGNAQEMQNIFDTQDGTTTLITSENGQRSGTRVRMPSFNIDVSDEVAEELDKYTMTNTGETKVINGYNCTKWVVTNKETGEVTESWITQDIDLDAQEVFTGIMRMSGGKPGQANNNLAPYEGMAVLTTMTDKKGTKTTVEYQDIRVGEANVDRSILDTSGVDIQDLTRF